ncbi:MAG: hypothetical protein NT045_09135 [Candidatus Aureabacteria bacterium]|nr:hypothetical protein [Candidatus Auribacterota bacterium]
MKSRIVVAFAVVLALSCAAGDLLAAGPKVNKDNFTFTPVSNTGRYVIQGPPGTVMGIAPIKVVALDKDTAEKGEAPVNPDGSFTITVDGTSGDKVKLKFLDAAGGKSSKSVKIPIMTSGSLLDGPQKVVNRKGETPGGSMAPGQAGRAVRGGRSLRRAERCGRARSRDSAGGRWSADGGCRGRRCGAGSDGSPGLNQRPSQPEEDRRGREVRQQGERSLAV